MLKGILLFLFSCCFVITGHCSENVSLQEGNNTQEQKANIWDFGQVKAGDALEHSFDFKNSFDKVINIEDVTTSCGCTASEVGKKALKPGESTLIKVKFNSRGYSGAVSQFVYVRTDNPKESITKFTIKANVVKQ